MGPVETPPAGTGAGLLAQGTLGKYRLVRELGRGGMGVVYLALDTSLNREVALKALHPALTVDGVFLARFREEAKAIAVVSHPNIVRVHAFDCIDGNYIIDMEYVPRGSVAQLLGTSISQRMAVEVIRQTLEGLAACHARGLIHRDVKPSNLLLAEGGRVLVGDFGLAKLFSEEERSVVSSTSGLFLGTPRYAPPEAWDAAEPAASWDVYACGVVLYEALTGVPPFDGRTPLQLVRQLASTAYRPLEEAVPGISPGLAHFVDRLMARDLARRPKDAGEALVLLREVLDTSDIAAVSDDTVAVPLPRKPALTLPATPKSELPVSAPNQRPRMHLAFSIVGIAFLVALTAAFAVWRWSAPAAPAPAPVNTAATQSATVVPPSSSPESIHVLGKKLIYVAADQDHGRELWVTDTDTGKSELLADISAGTASSDIAMKDAVTAGGWLLVTVHAAGSETTRLYRTDGTSAGTEEIFKAATFKTGRFVLFPGTGTHAYFNLMDGFQPSGLYETDGTKEGTRKVYGTPGYNEVTTLSIANDGGVYFAGNASQRLDYLAPGATESTQIAIMDRRIDGLITLGNRVLFTSGDEFNGQELWSSDITPGSSHLVKDIAPGKRDGLGDLQGENLAGGILFAADDTLHGKEPWWSDGNSEGTRLLKDLNPGALPSSPLRFTTVGQRCFFTAETAVAGRELWVTDGTEAGTQQLADINPGVDGSEPYAFCPFRDGLLFSARESVHGEELWFTDGTPGGTRLVKDINPGPADGSPGTTVALGDRAYFSGLDPAHGEELWTTDGTPEGTRLYADLYAAPEATLTPSDVTLALGKVFSVQTDPEHGAELWVRDNEGAAPHLVMDIWPGPTGSAPANFKEFNGRLYFVADDGQHGRELWRTDGTNAGTRYIADLADGKPGSAPDEFTTFRDDGQLGFTATMPNGEKQLYFMTRDEQSTRINTSDPEKPLLNPRKLSSDGYYLHFVADIAGRGALLWRTQDNHPEPEVP